LFVLHWTKYAHDRTETHKITDSHTQMGELESVSSN